MTLSSRSIPRCRVGHASVVCALRHPIQGPKVTTIRSDLRPFTTSLHSPEDTIKHSIDGVSSAPRSAETSGVTCNVSAASTGLLFVAGMRPVRGLEGYVSDFRAGSLM